MGNHETREGHERGAWWKAEGIRQGNCRGSGKARGIVVQVQQYTYLTEKVNTKIEQVRGFLGGVFEGPEA